MTNMQTDQGWNEDFFQLIGLGSIAKRKFEQVGGISRQNGTVLNAGEPVGTGLSEQAATDLGLAAGTPVGSAVIDA